MSSKRSRQQLEMVEYIYERIKLQLSVYTGKEDAGLTDLQNWYNNNHLKSQFTMCESCSQNIELAGHYKNCKIVRKYNNEFQ